MIAEELAHPDDRESQALYKRSQGTQIRTEQCRQHIDTLVDQVDGSPSRGRFRVHRVVREDKVRNIGDVWWSQIAISARA